jgi:hypothetical protein
MNVIFIIQNRVTQKIVTLVASVSLLLIGSSDGQAQTNQERKKVAVFHIDSNLPEYKPEQLGSLVRLELQKMDTFSVMDRYEMATLVKQNNIQLDNCYGRLCVVEAAKALQADKVITRSLEYIGDQLIYTIQYIDIQTGNVERSKVREFIYDLKEVQTITAVLLRDIFDYPIDPNVEKQMQRPTGYDARTREPVIERLRLDGPRVGATFFTGEAARILGADKNQGGFNAFPIMFQLGYQFERQYFSSGDCQALFEFIPTITGLDQGLAIPGFTFLNGIRGNKRGWELAIGPSFNVVQVDNGFYLPNGDWITKDQWSQSPYFQTIPTPNFRERLDSRGDIKLTSSFIVAIGKTLRSGNLNIPVNAFFIPARSGVRFGISVGYNLRNKSK